MMRRLFEVRVAVRCAMCVLVDSAEARTPAAAEKVRACGAISIFTEGVRANARVTVRGIVCTVGG